VYHVKIKVQLHSTLRNSQSIVTFCTPKINNLRFVGFALRLRWIWFQRVDDSRSWVDLPLPASHEKEVMTIFRVRDGASIRTCLDGPSVRSLHNAHAKLHAPQFLLETLGAGCSLINLYWVHRTLGQLLNSLPLPEENRWGYSWGSNIFASTKVYKILIGHSEIHPAFKWAGPCRARVPACL